MNNDKPITYPLPLHWLQAKSTLDDDRVLALALHIFPPRENEKPSSREYIRRVARTVGLDEDIAEHIHGGVCRAIIACNLTAEHIAA